MLMEVCYFSRFWPQSKHETSTIMIQLLYYAYVGISSLHHQFVSSKVNGLVATDPPRPTWPQLIRSVDLPNWVDNIYLTLNIITTPIYSRFAESEFNRQHGAHHIAFPHNFLPFQSPSRPVLERCRQCSRNYEAWGASGRKYKARIVIFHILAAVDRFSRIYWKVENR